MGATLQKAVRVRFQHALWGIGLSLLWAGCESDSDGSGPGDPGMPAGDGAVAAPDRDGAQQVIIHFAAVVGALPFACDSVYDAFFAEGGPVVPRDFKMYVQDLQLLRADGSAVPLSLDERPPFQTEGVALLDFEDNTGSCVGSPEVNTTITGTVPKGEYVGLRFVNGVPEALNHGDPTLSPPPLQSISMHWSWLLGYRFVKAEVATLSENGEAAGAGILHTGSVGCTGTPSQGIACSKGNRNLVQLDGFDPARDVVIADLAAIFTETSPLAGSDAQCHGTEQACASMYHALGIAFETGAPLPTQTVYRLQQRQAQPQQ